MTFDLEPCGLHNDAAYQEGSVVSLPYPCLVVDADAHSRASISDMLQSIGPVECFADAVPAAQRLRQLMRLGQAPRLLVLDAHLTGPENLRLVTVLRALEQIAGMKDEERCRVIACSMFRDTDQIARCFRHGADGFLYKPFGIDTLMRHCVQIGAIRSGSTALPS